MFDNLSLNHLLKSYAFRDPVFLGVLITVVYKGDKVYPCETTGEGWKDFTL